MDVLAGLTTRLGKIVFCLMAALGAMAGPLCGAGGAAVTLVREGATVAAIVLDAEKPTRSAQFAAFELQHHIRLITGAELPIVRKVEDVRGVALLVGESAATRALKIASGDLNGEEYLIRFAGDRIVLLGNDSPDYGTVNYADPQTFPSTEYCYRATTFAVYDFLEQCCGVRFYAFGDEGTAFEKRTTLAVAPLSRRFSPKMDAYRCPYFEGKERDLIPPRDLRLLLLRWRVNTLFGVANHSVYGIYWRYWDRAVSPSLAKLFVEKRPEYFAQGYAGTFSPSALRQQYPKDADLPPQLCTSQPGPVEYFADEAHTVFRGGRVEGGYGNFAVRMPGKPWYYPIQEDDSSCWCKCAACQQSFAAIPPELRYDYRHFDWVNRIAAAAAKRDPAMGVVTLAYSDTLAYPDPKILRIQPNVGVQMCLGLQSWYHPGIYALQHGAYKEWVEKEGTRRPLFVWLYLLCPAHEAQIIYKYNQFFPVQYPWQAGRYLKEFAQEGIRGYFAEVRLPYHLLEAYVANKMAFDPAADVDQLLDEYFTRYYGHAAEPMRRFYRRIEEITWNIANYPATTRIAYPKNSFTYGIHTEKVNWFLGTPERIAELQGLVSEAQRLATTPLEQRRLQWFTDHIWGQAVEGRKAFENREKARAVPIPQVTLGYAGECEGVLEKVDFSEAARSGGWALLDNSELAAKPELALASDSRYLYLRYREAGDVAWKHRDADLWANGVEIFLAAQPDYPFSHLVLAPNGEFKALRHVVIEGVVKMQDWPLKPVIANQLDENGWTFALAVPLAQLLPDRAAVPGDRIYANFMRTRLFDRQASWAWSPIFADTYVHGLYRMGQIYLAPTLQEGLLPVNGELTAAAGALPDGWVHNHLGKDTPPGRVAADKGRVSLVSTGDPVELYHRKVFPARRGDRIVFEFTASGKGTGAVGAYFCTGAADGAGRGFEQFAVTGEPRQFKIAVTVTNPNPARFTNGFHPVLAATPGAQVEVSGLKMQVVPR